LPFSLRYGDDDIACILYFPSIIHQKTSGKPLALDMVRNVVATTVALKIPFRERGVRSPLCGDLVVSELPFLG
jgi:hypothetical protein